MAPLGARLIFGLIPLKVLEPIGSKKLCTATRTLCQMLGELSFVARNATPVAKPRQPEREGETWMTVFVSSPARPPKESEVTLGSKLLSLLITVLDVRSKAGLDSVTVILLPPQLQGDVRMGNPPMFTAVSAQPRRSC